MRWGLGKLQSNAEVSIQIAARALQRAGLSAETGREVALRHQRHVN